MYLFVCFFCFQEYMDALNKQEIHQKQLAALSQQFTLLTNEVAALKTDKTSLQGLYEKQDATLGEWIYLALCKRNKNIALSETKYLDTQISYSL